MRWRYGTVGEGAAAEGVGGTLADGSADGVTGRGDAEGVTVAVGAGVRDAGRAVGDGRGVAPRGVETRC